jgi:addiction module HigA family antidote
MDMAHEIRLPKHRPPTLPGTLLSEEFLAPLGLTVTAFAKHIGIGRDRLSEIIHGRRRVTPDTAMRLSLALGTTVQFWLNAQMATDLYEAQQSANTAELKKIKPLTSASSAA